MSNLKTGDFVVNVRSYSMGKPGRAICNARNHHIVEDEPQGNGEWGEAINAAELLMFGVTSCGVTLIEKLAMELKYPLARMELTLTGIKHREEPQPHKHVTVFHEVDLTYTLVGVSPAKGKELVAAHQARCPMYGTVAIATPKVTTHIATPAK